MPLLGAEVLPKFPRDLFTSVPFSPPTIFLFFCFFRIIFAFFLTNRKLQPAGERRQLAPRTAVVELWQEL